MPCENSLLLTDLYELTMLHGYQQEGMNETAVFEFFFRELPRERNFLLAAGLEHALDFVEQAHFTEEELEWLAQQPNFPRDFIDFLADWRFRGELYAPPEGTVLFPQEPLLRVVAPLVEAQLLESRLINLLHYETLIASKAARCRLAAPNKQLVDFGMRRAHGAEAALLAARSTYIAGFDGTATVLAGQRWGIPVYGTMAHSYIQAHDSEAEAFAAFARAQPNNLVLLIDTYDTLSGARRVVELAPSLAEKGLRIKAVRLDSGDLAALAPQVRQILDEGGLKETRIFTSGGLDERDLVELIGADVPIDGYGVGTRVDTSSDRAYLDGVYKLTEYAGRPRRKRSEGKESWPGRKQVYRRYENGRMAGDRVVLEGETADGKPLLECVMRGGRRLKARESLAEIRDRAAAELAALPRAQRDLAPAPPYPVELAPSLHALAEEVDRGTAAETRP